MLGRFVDAVLARPRTIIVSLLAVSAFWAAQLPALRVEIDPDANLPQHHPYIQALHVLEERFGEKNLVLVGLFPHDGTVYTPAFLTALDRITRRIRDELPGLIPTTFLSLSSPLVKSIEGAGDDVLVRRVIEEPPRTQAEADEVRRRAGVNGLWVGNLVAADGSAAAIVANVRLTPELPGYPEIQDRIASIVAHENDGSFDARFGGPVTIAAGLAHVTERTFLLFPFVLLMIALLHYEAFRTLQGMILPIVTALLAVVWSLGLMGLLHLPLDPFNTTTPILILAVAAGHAVQILKRYYEELERTHDSREAVRAAILRVGPVMLTAGIIAALSFLSLTAFATATIRNFGLLSGVGILAALLIEMTLIPAVRVLLPAPRTRETEREARGGRMLESGLVRLAHVVAAEPRRVIAVTAVLLLLAAVAATRIHVDTSFKRQFGDRHPVRQDDAVLNRTFAGTNTLIFLVEGDRDEALHDPAALAAIADLQRAVEQDPAVGKTLSIVDLLREMHRALHGGDPATAPIPSTPELVSQYLFLYGLSGEPQDLDSQIDPLHRSAAVRVFLHQDSTEYGEHLLARVRDHVAKTFPPGLTVRYSGTVASNGALTETMVRGKALNMLQIALIIVTISAVVFRSLLAGLLVATPLAAAVLVNFGIMGALGVPLDVVTAPIAAMAVGIGSDYAIYFLFRLREETERTSDLAHALRRTMLTSGKAIVYVSSAIAGGYLVLVTSGFVFHIELGVLVALAMIVSSLAALTLMPALVLVLRPAFLFAHGLPVAEPVLRRAAI